MSEWVRTLSLYIVIGMGAGFGVLVMLYLYWAIFEKMIDILRIKKALVQFIWDRRRKKLKPKEKMQ